MGIRRVPGFLCECVGESMLYKQNIQVRQALIGSVGISTVYAWVIPCFSARISKCEMGIRRVPGFLCECVGESMLYKQNIQVRQALIGSVGISTVYAWVIPCFTARIS